jgi:hypothetical protein
MLPNAVPPPRQMRVVLVLSACLIVAPCALAAAAPRRVVPSDNSAIDQFLTTAPGPTGDERLRRGEQSMASAVPRRARTRLSAFGPAGDRAIAVLDQTAPGAVLRGGRRAVDSDRAPRSRAPVREVAAAAVGKGAGDGLGLALPGLLIAALAGALAAVIRRRTSRPGRHKGARATASNPR